LRGHWRQWVRSVHSDCMGCGIEPRKVRYRRGRVFLFARRQHVRHRYARCCRPAGVVRPHHVQRDRIGSWEVSRPTVSRHSSWEADEQSGAIRRGVGGAKGRDRGEYEPTKHAPNSEPGKRDTGRWLVYGNSLPSLPEVGAVCGKAARMVLCGGRAMKRASLPLRRRQLITLLGGAAVSKSPRWTSIQGSFPLTARFEMLTGILLLRD
jgi:hypothetical protein